jgi:hypothetical protein
MARSTSTAFYAAHAAQAIEPADGEILVGAIDCKRIPIVKPERALRVVRRGKGENANQNRIATAPRSIASRRSCAPPPR